MNLTRVPDLQPLIHPGNTIGSWPIPPEPAGLLGTLARIRS
jgi:hypothetical protein